jgi:hypothetical protein
MVHTDYVLNIMITVIIFLNYALCKSHEELGNCYPLQPLSITVDWFIL